MLSTLTSPRVWWCVMLKRLFKISGILVIVSYFHYSWTLFFINELCANFICWSCILELINWQSVLFKIQLIRATSNEQYYWLLINCQCLSTNWWKDTAEAHTHIHTWRFLINLGHTSVIFFAPNLSVCILIEKWSWKLVLFFGKCLGFSKQPLYLILMLFILIYTLK